MADYAGRLQANLYGWLHAARWQHGLTL